MKVLIIDNYDSFTYNLVHMVRAVGVDHNVVRNDKFELSSVNAYDKLILSPGPGIPDEAGRLKEVIRRYSETKSILGVCLGHQAIGEVFGSKLKLLNEVHHGVSTDIEIFDEDYLFKGMDKTMQVGRYHSWVIDESEISDQLEVIATDGSGEIMALRHKDLDIRGVQFHPESILTPLGTKIIENFLFENNKKTSSSSTHTETTSRS